MLSGDSGHGFKMFPIFGSWVSDVVETSQQRNARWRWKQSNSNDGKGNWGGDVSWRLGESKELSEIKPKISSKL